VSLELETAPILEPLTITDLRDHLRIDTDSELEAEELKAYISAARRWCEMMQKRAYITQTWNWALDSWPTSPVNVPKPPLQSVSSIMYYDTDETGAEFSSDYYQQDVISQPGRISLVYGQTWPSTTLRPMNGIVIQFIAGYGTAETAVPDNIVQAIRLLAGHWYENRENSEIKKLEDIPFGVEALLWQERVGII